MRKPTKIVNYKIYEIAEQWYIRKGVIESESDVKTGAKPC